MNMIIHDDLAVTNDHDKEILKARYISPEERQEIIDHLRLI